MYAELKSEISQSEVLGKATLNAAARLGISQQQLENIIGRNRSSISRSGINPKSKEGELSLLLIRCYRSLHALMGGDDLNVKHFMQTKNRITQGVPKEQIYHIHGLVYLVQFLDAMRGRA
jgi:hypothetical protein